MCLHGCDVAIRPQNSPSGSSCAAPDAGRLYRDRRDRRFPGETEADFRTTYEFLERLAPAYLHIFPFSERSGTPAVDFPDKVQPSVATRRVEELEKLCRRLHGEFCARAEGTTDEVLFESTMRAG